MKHEDTFITEVDGSSDGRSEALATLKRVVIKIGSTTVRSLDMDLLADIVHEIRGRGIDIAIVSSGAVACGMQRVGLTERPSEVRTVQALAAIGQAELMARYSTAFSRHGLITSQVLLTHGDLADRKNFISIRSTLQALGALGAICIANENDTVATDELRFGDNDRLAAAFATVLDAEMVILLTDISALFDKDPSRYSSARPIAEVFTIDDEIRAMAGAAGSNVGTGGMASKIEAADLATKAGIPLVIADGSDPSVLLRILDAENVGTFFHPNRQITRRRHWIGYFSRTSGVIQVDEGASVALKTTPASLLPVGVTAIEGHFAVGDAVEVRGPDGTLIGRGLVNYDNELLQIIRGLNCADISARLRRTYVDPVIHRNDFVSIGDL